MTWLIHSEKTHSRIHTCDMKTRTLLFIRVTCIVWHMKHSIFHMCDMAHTPLCVWHSCVWHDAFTTKKLAHMYGMKTKNILWHLFFYLVLCSKHKKTLPIYDCVMSRIRMSHFHICDRTQSYIGRVNTYMKWLICEWFISHTARCYVTYMNKSFHIYYCVMSYIWTSLRVHSQK